jgi:hypothetical protein
VRQAAPGCKACGRWRAGTCACCACAPAHRACSCGLHARAACMCSVSTQPAAPRHHQSHSHARRRRDLFTLSIRPPLEAGLFMRLRICMRGSTPRPHAVKRCLHQHCYSQRDPVIIFAVRALQRSTPLAHLHMHGPRPASQHRRQLPHDARGGCGISRARLPAACVRCMSLLRT